MGVESADIVSLPGAVAEEKIICYPYRLDIHMTCTDAGNADIAWSNIYASVADGHEQGVYFSPAPLVYPSHEPIYKK